MLSIGIFINYSMNYFKKKRKTENRPKYRPLSSIAINDQNKSLLDPNFVTGFCDAECSFVIYVIKQKSWKVSARFRIHLHSLDLPLLHKIQAFFGGIGSITFSGKTVSFNVTKLDDIINVIIPHFIKYPLQSAKSIDFQLWKKCAILIKNKEHLTEDGLHKILSLKSVLNLGLSVALKAAFPNVITIARPIFTVPSAPLNPHWVSGFIEGDGSFTISIYSTTNQVKIRLMVGLNRRENGLIQKMLEFFAGAGRINFSPKQGAVFYTVANIKDLTSLIVPHFDTYKLIGNKYNNYLIWREILLKVSSKAHLTPEGLNQIKELRSKLNKYPKGIEGGEIRSSTTNSTETRQAISNSLNEFYKINSNPFKGLKGALSPQYGIGGTSVFFYSEGGKELNFPSINAAKQHFKCRWQLIKKNIDTNNWITLQSENWKIESTPRQNK